MLLIFAAPVYARERNAALKSYAIAVNGKVNIGSGTALAMLQLSSEVELEACSSIRLSRDVY